MNDNESRPSYTEHTAEQIKEILGKEVICFDGEKRTVESVAPCFGRFDSALINPTTEHTGHLIHLLSLFAQIRNEPIPSDEELKQFSDIANSFSIEYQKNELPPAMPQNRKQRRAAEVKARRSKMKLIKGDK